MLENSLLGRMRRIFSMYRCGIITKIACLVKGKEKVSE